jgi:phosphoserine aminotransferase
VDAIGGVSETIKRSQRNFQALEQWIDKTDWVNFLASYPQTRSTTSVCLTLSIPEGIDEKMFVKSMTSLLDKNNAAKDIGAYRDAPAGLRIWCGATVETSDIQTLIPWLEWAYDQSKREFLSQAA